MDALDVARALLSSGHSQDHRFFYPGEERVSKVIVGLPGRAPVEITQARSRPWSLLRKRNQPRSSHCANLGTGWVSLRAVCHNAVRPLRRLSIRSKGAP